VLAPVFPPAMGGLSSSRFVACVARWRGISASGSPRFFSALVVLTAGFPGLARYANAKSNATFASRLPELPPYAEIVCLQCFRSGYLYLKRFVTVVTDGGKEFTSNYIIFMLNNTKSWPEGVVRLSERNRWLASRDHPLYLIARKSGRESLESSPPRAEPP